MSLDVDTATPNITNQKNVTSALQTAVTQTNTIILGKEQQIRLCLACIIARGHLLIEDIPGVGKTTLAQALAKNLGLSYQRIQFTSDLLPADIIGAAVYHRDSESFRFHAGPIFSQLILADEVNRATPKTQSALLEAMEEHQVTVDGETRPLPEPFFVIATQNPNYQVGTFPLPESQLDRFLMRVELGYPEQDAERDLLRGQDRRTLLTEIDPAMATEDLIRMQLEVDSVIVAEALLDYIQAIVAYTRESAEFISGMSPRAALALKRSAQAWALMDNRDAVLPEDVQAVLPGVIGHRVQFKQEHARNNAEGDAVARAVIEAVAIP
ncbi:MAG: MoxR family ATPase [Gammaproteobacteria bacterium]|nr:MoxR family ATPase [Gammaproteobacteria bacterium]